MKENYGKNGKVILKINGELKQMYPVYNLSHVSVGVNLYVVSERGHYIPIEHKMDAEDKVEIIFIESEKEVKKFVKIIGCKKAPYHYLGSYGILNENKMTVELTGRVGLKGSISTTVCDEDIEIIELV